MSEMLRLDGHSFSMTAIRTADEVWFLADCLASETGIEKYHVSFLYDVDGYLKSLEMVKALKGTLFIPAHADATENIAPLAQRNIDKVMEIIGLLKAMCLEPASLEELQKRIFDHYDLAMDFNQYVLVGSTLRSYLSYLHDKKEMEVVFEGNRLLFQTVTVL